MDIKKLKAFRNIAIEGTYTAAAEPLKEHPTTIRKWVHVLESELNVTLFEVKDRRLVLTQQGEDFLPHAERMIEIVESELSSFEEDTNGMNGKITLATTHATANLWIADAMKKFISDFPKLRVTIKASDDYIDLIHRHADVAVSLRKTDTELFVHQQLTHYKMDLYASESYIEKYGMPNSVDDLYKNHKIISYGVDVPFPYNNVNWHLSFFPDDFKPALSVNSGAAIFKFVQLGLGIGSISDLGAKCSKVPIVKILPDVIQGLSIPVYLVYPKSRQGLKKIDALYEYLKEGLNQEVA